MSALEERATGFTGPYRWRFEQTGSPGEETRQWILTRNCALGPQQLAACLGVLVVATLLIAIIFSFGGYWPVLPFAGIEALALMAGFVCHGRHAADRERILACGDRLVVEWTCGARVSRTERIANWVRVEYGGRRGDLVRLVAGGTAIEVGRYVPGERRGALARELRTALMHRGAGAD